MTSLFRRASLWITASLALNLFLAGLLIGGIASPGLPFARHARPPAPVFSVEAVMLGLPEAERATVRRVIGAKSGEIRGAIRALRRAQGRAGDAVAADPLDQAALQSALEELRARNGDVQAVVHAMIEDLAGTLEPADRARLARAMFQGSPHGIPLVQHGPQRRHRERRG